jgi:hypothetical protein
MGEISKLYKKVANDPKKQDIIFEVLEHFEKSIKRCCPEEYKDMYLKLHKEVYGNHFCECLAKKAVEEMTNVDGSHGGFWSFESALAVRNQYGCNANEYDWWYVLNMVRSDYFEVIGDNIAMYVGLAKAYIEDPDAPDDKVIRTYLATHEI